MVSLDALIHDTPGFGWGKEKLQVLAWLGFAGERVW
jgi:hypothetical protein